MQGFIKRYSTLPIREIWLVDIEDGKEILARTFDFQDNNTMTQTAGFGKS